MSRFTKAVRQQIVRDFALRHNGQYNPGLFLEEVRRTGPSHPAYQWFEWDTERAALNYQIEQAREFARDLRVTFKVEEVGRRGNITVRTVPMPMVLSPTDQRRGGGGYHLVDQNDPSHMVEHCRQALTTLKAWLARYEAALVFAGLSTAPVLKIVNALESTQPPQKTAAE